MTVWLPRFVPTIAVCLLTLQICFTGRVSGEEPFERWVTAAREFRDARLVAKVRYSRASDLLEAPIRSSWTTDLQLGETRARYTEATELVGREGFSFIESIVDGGQCLTFSTITSDVQGQSIHFDEFHSATLRAPGISNNGETVNTDRVLMLLRNVPIFGIVNSVRIEQWLDASNKLEAESDNSDPRSQLLTKRTDDYGQLKVQWSRPGDVFPVSVELTQARSDRLSADKRLSDLDMRGGGGWPKGYAKRVHTEMTVVDWDDTEMDRRPTHWRATRHYVCQGDVNVTETWDLQQITFAPSPSAIDRAPVTPYKIGSRVNVRDASHLNYIFDGQWAVPEVRFVSQVTGAPGISRTTLTVLGLAVLAVAAIGFLTFRKRKYAEK
ncbi:hypothetical protein [Crateriforma conspicua]|uniref:Uncharacterized protein n=1 Tax=Crateriforma conspicua TaxID=2527996 RepID=A0A5C5Y5C4_9PLAN|nr:hypothetical protein [Crateriforma conspicua]TWT69913.1 hypothetical protein Pan14r_22100 [Crateriforma conspicua]